MRTINNISQDNYTTSQLKLQQGLLIKIDKSETVYTFNSIMNGVNLSKYLNNSCKDSRGRKGYNNVNVLKVILFGFMNEGYISLRKLEELCKYDIRYKWLLNDENVPSHMTFSNFINYHLLDNIENIFNEIIQHICKLDSVDLSKVYIDGTKLEANANKYSFVWKKSCLTNRVKLYGKISDLIKIINAEDLIHVETKFDLSEEYSIGYMNNIVDTYQTILKIDKSTFTSGKGNKKASYQNYFELLDEYRNKLSTYAHHIKMCGNDRNSYSKTDKDATFMRIKKDYMGNDQLLPAYNMQILVADEYIVAADAYQFAADTSCFVPMMKNFYETFNEYPKCAVGDAGYGSYNNYIFCEENNIEKALKFSMYEKTVEDKKYRENPFKVSNFKRDKDGDLICPNNRKFKYLKSIPVKDNLYGRTNELYQCVNCNRCPLKKQCHKSKENRVVNLNEELTSFHKEVINNLESIKGALLRMNRSIQVEGAFGVIKQDYNYRRVVRKGIENVKLEFLLVSIGFNLRKFHNKSNREEESVNIIS